MPCFQRPGVPWAMDQATRLPVTAFRSTAKDACEYRQSHRTIPVAYFHLPLF